MNVSAPENFAPHSGNEKVVDLDHLDDLDLPLHNPEPATDVVGGFDILHRQLDPEERIKVVRDFSLVKKPTEIMDLGKEGNPDFESEGHLVEKIDEALKDEDYDKAYELAKKIENDEVLLSTVQGVITSLIADKKFSLAEKFALLIRDTDAYRKELANIIDSNSEANSALSDFSEESPNNVENNSAPVSSPIIKSEGELVVDPIDDSAVNRIKIKRIGEKPVVDLDVISDEDFENFVKTGEVSGDILVLIAERISRGEKITEREMAIYDTFKDKIELLLKNRLGLDAHSVESETQEYKVGVKELDKNRSRDIFEKVKIIGDEFGGERLTTEILEQEGLMPKYEVTVGDTKYFFASSGYALEQGRIGVVAYVQKGDDVVARSYYKSNSQGVWRYLPDYIENDGEVQWFGKGMGEESITLPFLVQKALSLITSDRESILQVSDPDLVLAGTAKKYGKGGTYYNEVDSSPKKIEGNFYNKNKKISPEQLAIDGNEAPDFTKPLVSWYENNSVYGRYKIEVFPSKDGNLKYMFCRDAKGRAWIAGIEDNSELQSSGLRKSWITGGDLTTPAFEYDTQSGGYGNYDEVDSSLPYVDMFKNYLSKSPIINDYLESRKNVIEDEDAVIKITDEGIPVIEPEIEDLSEVVPPIPTVESVNNSEKLEKDLEDSRRELVALETVWRSKNQQSKSWVRRNLLGNLGLDKQTPLVPEPTELEQAKMVYNLAKKNKLRETIGAGNTASLLQEVEKEKNAFENLKSTYKPKVVKESQLNRDIRTGILGLNPKEEEGTVYEVEQGAIAEKFSSSVKKGVEVWSKLPKPVQLATSTALVTGTSFTFGLAAAAGPLGYAGYRVAKSALVGGVVSQPFGKVVDKIHERKNKASDKESMEEFSEGINLDNFMEKEAERMARDEKMVDEKKRQRFVKAIGKVAVGGITSAGMELTGASDILFGPKDIDLPGKGTLNVPNDYGDMDKYLDKLEKTRVANAETLTSDNHLDNLEQIKSTIEDNNPIVTETKVELSSKGFMQDMHNLKANIMAEYGGEVPDSLKPIMNKTPMELAKAFHFYDQESNTSGLGFKGESLGVDSNGDIFYEHLDGNKQIIFDAQKGEFHHFDGKMVGSTSKVVPGSEIYPNGKIGDDVYSKLDFGGNKIITPDPIVKTAGVEVLEGDPIFKTEAISVLDVKDTTAEEIAKNNISHIEVAGGKSVDVWRMGEDKIVSFDGARIGQEIEENGKRVLVLDDTYQDGAQYESYRNAFSKAFEQNTSVDVVGPNPIAESFEGGKIYISYNVPNDPNSIRVLLNGKEIATGSTTIVDRNGIPKIRMHGNLKGGWFLVDNAYERAFKHIDKLIKAGNFNFKI